MKAKSDRIFLTLTLVLTLLGLIAVADTSNAQAQIAFDDPLFFFRQQTLWALIGLTGFFTAAYVPYKTWSRLALPAFFFSLILLILVLVPGIGSKIYGARRWLSLGPVGFQPSEIVKLTMIIMIAQLATLKHKHLTMLALLAFVIFLVMLQPDLGTSIILSSIGLSQIFLVGIPFIQLLGALSLAALSGTILILTSDYRRERLSTFLQGATDTHGTGYHIRQVLIALGSGGLFGVGLGKSIQKHLFLPESATDSVFAILAEEIGFIGAFAVILLLSFYVLRAIRIATKAPDIFSFALASGISVWFASQIFFNISSMVALTPLTGIPLPFFSYGGTSLTMILVSAGILLNISRYEQKNR